MSGEAEKRTNMFHRDPATLRIKKGLNARDLTSEAYQAKIRELAEDIAVNGVRTPIETFSEGGETYVSHGHTRFAALQLLIEEDRAPKTVPCIPEPRGRNDADRIVDQYRLNVGSPLSPVEVAYNIGRLLKLGWDKDKIAERHTKSVSWVEHVLTFGEATPETQAAVAAGKISASLATEIVRKEGPTKAARTIEKAVKTAKAEGKDKATARHVQVKSGETEATVKQMRKLVSILRVQASRGGAGAGQWAARWLAEAQIVNEEEE